MSQRAALVSKRRCVSQLLFCCQAVLIALWLPVAESAPRRNEKQPELNYHQPVVDPGDNKHHKKSKGTQVDEVGSVAAAGPCNRIVCENALAGNPPSEWQLTEPGDAAIQGFATDQSVNAGGTIRFKVRANTPYHIDIYRVGWYQGNGARRVAQLINIPAQTQPACRVDTTNTTGLIDCGNWTESASWAVPASATSGAYFARLVRNSNNAGAGYMHFIVRDDASHSDIVYQASDTQRAAYNNFGGNSLYQCTINCPPGNPQLYKGAYKVSFNRPNIAVNLGMQYSFFGAEFELVEFLEANGYDVSYVSAVDVDRSGALVKNHKIFISSGHDEYWSRRQRDNVEAARDAGVNLAFFSGNEVFWKTRYEASLDGSTAYRTLVSYKDTHFDARVDPVAWTGLWRDGRFVPAPDGGRPENAMTGTIYTVDPVANFQIEVPAADGKMRFWRGTAVATQAAGQIFLLAPNSLGYEWDEDLDNGSRPSGIVRMSSTTKTVPNHLVDPDVGNHYDTGVATHHLTLHRAPSGALVFGAGTVQWAWGLEGSPDGKAGVDVNMQQATVNLFADMSVQPTTLIAGLAAASKSTDTTPPTATITSPANGATVTVNTLVNVIGTATDSGGGVVGGVEISTDGGASWHPASSGRASWMYQWRPLQPGNYKLMARAADDSANLGAPSTQVSITAGARTCPCSLWTPSDAPIVTTDADTNAIELGVKFSADSNGTISGVRFFKSATNTGIHVGSLWTANGQLLAQQQFSGESATGWQQVNFPTPVNITAGTHYVVSYHTNVGHYAGDTFYFFDSAYDNPPLHALKNGADGGNGVYLNTASSAFPTQTYNSTNYWVDAVFNTAGSGGDVTPPSVTSRTPSPSATGVALSTAVSATFSESVQQASIVLKNSGGTTVAGTLSYNNGTFTATLVPNAPLSASATYTATVNGAKDAAGNPMSATPSWSFTTGAAQTTACPCTIWPASASPTVATDADINSIEVGVKFRVDVSGFISGLRFYKSSTNAGPHVGTLWSSSGARLASVTFTNETGSGWQQMNFNTPVAVSAGTTYVASYHANSGHYAGDTGFFATAGADNGPLHALRNGLDGANGVYIYNALPTFPTQTFQSTNYWVDVVFNTPGGTSTSSTIWAASAAPTVPGDGDTRSIELGVKFRADVNGSITGIRFYKSSTNTGTHVVTLWRRDGTMLAQAQPTSETASGWQQANFTTPVAITAGTTYVASYHALNGHYADDTGYFTGSGVDNGSLHALRDGVDGANGLYSYSAGSTFPTNAFQGSNYWVDVVFKSP